MQFTSLLPCDNPRKRVMIGVGASEGTIEVPCTLSLFNSAVLLHAARIQVSLCIEAGNCHVDDMRNSIVATFLASDCDELVFIDEDVGFLAPDLLKLIMCDKDLVGGAYPKKQDDECFPVLAMPGPIWTDEEGLCEVKGLPTGLLKIKRGVIDTLAQAAKSFIGNDGRTYHEIFYREIWQGRKWSHDYTLCRNWQRAGGKLYVIPDLVLSHTGKKTWVGNLRDHWRRSSGVDATERAESLVREVAKLKAGEPDFEALHAAWGNEQWTACPKLLSALWDRCEPGSRVLECGSGLSTLVLAARGCEVTVFEHEPAFASHIGGVLDQFGLSARIACRPLKDGWYDFEGGEFDALVIDGPPRTIADRSIALDRVKAPLVIWDDYEGGLEAPEIIAGTKTFAIGRR